MWWKCAWLLIRFFRDQCQDVSIPIPKLKTKKKWKQISIVITSPPDEAKKGKSGSWHQSELELGGNLSPQFANFWRENIFVQFLFGLWLIISIALYQKANIRHIDSIAASLFVLNWLSWQIVSIRWQGPNNNTDTDWQSALPFFSFLIYLFKVVGNWLRPACRPEALTWLKDYQNYSRIPSFTSHSLMICRWYSLSRIFLSTTK